MEPNVVQPYQAAQPSVAGRVVTGGTRTTQDGRWWIDEIDVGIVDLSVDAFIRRFSVSSASGVAGGEVICRETHNGGLNANELLPGNVGRD